MSSIYERLLTKTADQLPHFYKKFSDQIINNEASLFIGAGVSRNSGYPGWADLLSECAEELNVDLNKIDLYSLAQYYANEHSDSDLRSIINNKINKIPQESNLLLNSLLEIGFNSIWTTNYEKSIETELGKKCIPHNIIVNDKNLASIDCHDKVNIYKMNGDISEPINMILTKNDYEHYLKKHPLFLTFLKRELVSNTFLFIGYSFSDALVLDCLCSIQEFLGGSMEGHYAIMYIDENVSQDFYYFVEDLKKRYNITCLCASKDGMLNIINCLNGKTKEKKVFISGSYDSVTENTNNFADKLSCALVNHLYNSGYRISTGVGKRLGTYITGYANQYLAERNISNTPKYLSMRPFPFHMNLSEEKKETYRKLMQRDCSAAIFLFGQSRNMNKAGMFDDNIAHFSTGTYQEFQIAKANNFVIIPVGATGYEANIIWKEVKANINQFYYLSKKIDILRYETEPQKISEVIVNILNSVTEYRCIKQ